MAAAEGAIRTVTSSADSGAGSLRNVVSAAAAGDTVRFGVTGTIALSGFITLDKNLIIDGPGADVLTLTINGLPSSIFITINNAAVTVAGVTITGGTSALRHTSGNLTVLDCVLTGNDLAIAQVNDPVALNVTRCAFIFNRPITALNAADIYVTEPSAVVPNPSAGVGNCTFRRGSVNSLGALTFTSCTFSDAVIRATSTKGKVQLLNNILSDTSLIQQSNNHFVSLGNNLCNTNADGLLTESNDLINTDPLLDTAGPLPNGARTPTIALMAGSPAIDRGNRYGLTTDQRGVARPFDNAGAANASDGADIGAYEATDPVQHAPSLLVNTLTDHDDGTAGVADCTLREALRHAEGRGPHTIAFAPGLTGTILLDRNLGSLRLTNGLTIRGPGARQLAVSAGGYMRVFTADNGIGGQKLITGLTIRDGVESGQAPGASAAGGGIYNGIHSFLRLEDCLLDHHFAGGTAASLAGFDGGAGRGGGIYNQGILQLERCTFTSCVAGGGGGAPDPDPNGRGGDGGAAEGGAVFHDAAGAGEENYNYLTVNNCTFYGNSASGGSGRESFFGGAGGNGRGGAIFSNGLHVTVTACTFSGNVSQGGSGGDGRNNLLDGPAGIGSGALIGPGGDPIVLRSSILAGNTRNAGFPSDVAGTFASEGYNVIGTGDGASGFVATDQRGTNAALLNAQIGPLQSNGGQTNTMLPLTGSPAIDKGKNFSTETVIDQRGITRVLDHPAITNAAGGDGTDAGAVEADAPLPGPVFIVTTLDDHDDGVASALDCTLREAIKAANSTPGPDTILFQAGLSGDLQIKAALGLLTVQGSPLSIIGPGARRLIIRGGAQTRVFTFEGGPHFVSGLMMANGQMYPSGESGESIQGGGVLCRGGTLTMVDCALSANQCQGAQNNTVTGGAGGNGEGGGIANTNGGTLTLLRCTVSDNTAQGGRGAFNNGNAAGGRGGDGLGSGIYNGAGCTLTMSNCTISNNVCNGGPGRQPGGNGGNALSAIYNLGNMSVTSCTVSYNGADGGTPGSGQSPAGNGVPGRSIAGMSAGAVSLIRNSICTGNSSFDSSDPADVDGTFTSGGFNFIGIAVPANGFNGQNDQKGTAAEPLDAMTGFMQNNGGQTDTLLPGEGSPVVDRGRSFALTSDQIGQARIWDDVSVANVAGGDGTDIGAVEVHPPFVQGSPLVITSFSITNDAVVQIKMRGAPLTLYRLEAGEMLLDFSPVSGNTIRSDALGIVDFIDTRPLPRRRLYVGTLAE